MIRLFVNAFRVPDSDKQLARAQFGVFARQIPVLYAILIFNNSVLAYAFYGSAPVHLTLYLPLFTCGYGLTRIFWWAKQVGAKISHEETLRHLRRIQSVGALLCIISDIWAFSLYPYGDAFQKSVTIFFLGMTIMGSVFCLMYLRSAALLFAACVCVPTPLFFFAQGNLVLIATAIDLCMIGAGVIYVLYTYYNDFSDLVASRAALAVKQAETERLSQENFRIANLDSLTDLPNRRSFFAALEVEIARSANKGTRLAVGIVDLDGFKPVNDTYGHAAGDAVLLEVGRRLGKVCQGVASIFRLGGDEFGLAIEAIESDEKLRALGAKILDSLSAPFVVGANQTNLGGSVGFAVYPDMAQTALMLYERADYALYYAKRHTRGEVVLFSKKHEEEIKSYGVVEIALKHADIENEISLAFQPIVDARTGKPLAFEALARWTSPTLGPISPGVFVPVAERSGYIRQITRCLLAKALAEASTWPADVRVSFNLSAHDISSPEAVLHLIAIIGKSNVSPRRIDFEITESAVIHDFAQASAAIASLKTVGCGMSLDDFGTGYSSLACVHRLPFDKIKVDRSFITDISTNAVSYNIVKSVRALCVDMDVSLVVEGVETEDQLKTLSRLGCHVIQGYLFSKPMPPAAIPEFLAAHAKVGTISECSAAG